MILVKVSFLIVSPHSSKRQRPIFSRCSLCNISRRLSTFSILENAASTLCTFETCVSFRRFTSLFRSLISLLFSSVFAIREFSRSMICVWRVASFSARFTASSSCFARSASLFRSWVAILLFRDLVEKYTDAAKPAAAMMMLMCSGEIIILLHHAEIVTDQCARLVSQLVFVSALSALPVADVQRIAFFVVFSPFVFE